MKPNATSAMASLSTVADPKLSATEHINEDILCLDYMKDFKQGPLDNYRKKASFDWKMMRVFLDGEDVLRFKVSCGKSFKLRVVTADNSAVNFFFFKLGDH